MSVELDMESQTEKSLVLEKDSNRKLRKWRVVILVVRLIHSFATTFTVESPKQIDPDDELIGMSSTTENGVTYTEIANLIAKNAKLNILQWGVCFLIGGGSIVVDLLNKCIPDLFHGSLLLKQQCYITKSPCMSRSPSSSGPPSLLELPFLKDDPQGPLATIDSIQPFPEESL